MKIGSFVGKYVLFKLRQDKEKLNRLIIFKVIENVVKIISFKMDKNLGYFYV